MSNMQGGLTNSVIRDPGNNNFIIKTYTVDSIIQGFGRNHIERMTSEFAYLTYFSTLGIAPKPESINIEKQQTVIEFFDGLPIGIDNNAEEALPGTQIAAITRVLNTIHSPVKGMNIGLKHYENIFQKYLQASKEILENEGISVSELSEIVLDILRNKKSMLERMPITLIHGDFWLNNVLLNKQSNAVRVIDLEHAGTGTPYIDLGTYYIYSKQFKNALQILEGYRYELDFELTVLFGIFRVLKLLSFIDYNIYNGSNVSDKYSFKYMLNVVSKELNNLKINPYV